jgi:hypothetical protein
VVKSVDAFKRPQWLIVFTLFFLAFLPAEAFGKQHTYKSQLVTIYYNDEHLLEEFEDKIRPSSFTYAMNTIFLGENGTSKDASLGEFVDTLFKRVQQILDMPLPSLRVNIQLLKNQRDVSWKWASITGKPTKAPAFYWKKTNTIYLQPKVLTTGILAHEMGHAVIDHYFVIRPPSKIAEMLCEYVDKEISSQPF